MNLQVIASPDGDIVWGVRGAPRVGAREEGGILTCDNLAISSGLIAPRENLGRCGSRRAGAAAASGLGIVRPCGVADIRGGLPVTSAHYGIRTRNLAWPLGS